MQHMSTAHQGRAVKKPERMAFIAADVAEARQAEAALIRRYGRPRVPIVLHPDAYLKRKNVHPDGHESEHIPPSQRDLEAEDVEIIEERGPTMVIGGRALVTGQIPRTTPSKKAARRRSRGSTANGSPTRGFTTTRRLS